METFTNSIPHFKLSLEHILKRHFGEFNPNLRNFRGRMSIYPARVDPSLKPGHLAGRCAKIGRETALLMVPFGYHLQEVESNQPGFDHTYLRAVIDWKELLVDLTLPQYFWWMRNGFVGGRDELRQIVRRHCLSGARLDPALEDISPNRDPDEIFNTIWGGTSVPRSEAV
ncbi:hypothetical protein A2631_02035 [Candidatus Daviesbacteria bacterium RIFCSPHIGHO2_01_FULL_44_29]|uniref:Uncharacterized protein n=1 Tax=Candidatus Daviesbacteria bacterium RIFCSPHIGHO2_02_FULL_43_12 TaxID=1797776 RepID=A0A1F5KJR2_9BACT|nr:MAG: hypothetical protein A2631_02035 [Candidatus Daviesbacteria bacterium RIFCSPHIGHO2_01_FULL_44_29]OGE39548.1 MAG: hypothetical protein A3E86_01865 [Candidatus Daviesbacteria bacterium RIFCSPHIGHO2_12_FULL_47_45]OGE41176.1 MAG: hypothetical protein A3D25_01430 [Candidatus Daviesbacteria bacterium RIFCSPHIGHO2_02_FULL_43_12]OGE69375.1 MAG: hypothetical protein A3B55_03170 [Candidatus Daviesbacteria bacterium RIFCSPLOWO2_01_FULL_43_15]